MSIFSRGKLAFFALVYVFVPMAVSVTYTFISPATASAATFATLETPAEKVRAYYLYQGWLDCINIGQMSKQIPSNVTTDPGQWSVGDASVKDRAVSVGYVVDSKDGMYGCNDELYPKAVATFGITDYSGFLTQIGYRLEGTGDSAKWKFVGCSINTGGSPPITQSSDQKTCFKAYIARTFGEPKMDTELYYERNKITLDTANACQMHFRKAATLTQDEWTTFQSTYPNQYSEYGNPQLKLVNTTENSASLDPYYAGTTKRLDGVQYELGSNNDGTTHERATCRQMLTALNNFAPQYKAILDQRVADGTFDEDRVAGRTNQDDPENVGDNCPLAPGAPMRWLGCGVFAALSGAANKLTEQLDAYLYTDPSVFSDEAQKTATVFRNIGMALVIIAGLLMVISQALGFEFLNAYTIRKLLPKLGIALIGMALAWPLLKLAVDLTNDIGGMISSVFMDLAARADQSGGEVGAGSTVVAVMGSLTALAGATAYSVLLGPLGFLTLIGTIVLALLIALLVLSLRQLVIFVAVIMAPLAIAAYVFPGGEKLWKFWKTTLITTLLMYPLIMGFISAGAAMAFIMPQEPAEGGGTRMSLLAIIVYFAPFFMLPFAFKLAGGLMSTIFSLVNDKNRGAFDRFKKMRSNSVGKRSELFANRSMGNKLTQATIGETARRVKLADQGGFSVAPQARRRYRGAAEHMEQMARLERMKRDGGVMAGATDVNEVLSDRSLSYGAAVDRLAEKHKKWMKSKKGLKVSDDDARDYARTQIGRAEAAYGARFGTRGLATTAGMALFGDNTAFINDKGTDFDGEDGLNAVSKRLMDAGMSASDVTQLWKSNKMRGDISSVSTGSILAHLSELQKGHTSDAVFTAKSWGKEAARSIKPGELLFGHPNTANAMIPVFAEEAQERLVAVNTARAEATRVAADPTKSENDRKAAAKAAEEAYREFETAYANMYAAHGQLSSSNRSIAKKFADVILEGEVNASDIPPEIQAKMQNILKPTRTETQPDGSSVTVELPPVDKIPRKVLMDTLAKISPYFNEQVNNYKYEAAAGAGAMAAEAAAIAAAAGAIPAPTPTPPPGSPGS